MRGERQFASTVRKLIAELSLELDQAREELAADEVISLRDRLLRKP